MPRELFSVPDVTAVGEIDEQGGKTFDVIRKGLHYLTYFRMDGSGVKEIDRACRLNDTILRQLVIKHPPALFEAMVQAVTAPAEGAEEQPEAAKPVEA